MNDVIGNHSAGSIALQVRGATVDFTSLGTRMEFALQYTPSVPYPIATQNHGNGSCCGEVSIPWVCVEKDNWTPGPRCHANIHAVQSVVKSTVAERTLEKNLRTEQWRVKRSY